MQLKHIVTMMGGTALAQVIPLAISPILSRLYTPSEFGIFSTLVAASAVLSIFITARYELAIILPADDKDAASITLGVLGLAFGLTAIAIIVLFFAGAPIKAAFGLSSLGGWIYFIPVLALLMALGQLGSNVANRYRNYMMMARVGVIQQIVNAVLSTAIGISRLNLNGLVIGRIVGQGAYSALLFVTSVVPLLKTHRVAWCPADSVSQLKKYHQFPLFNLPYSLIGTFSKEFIIFALTAFCNTTVAGYYGLARTVLNAPVSFLSSSLSQVFYREAAERKGTREFAELTKCMLLGLSVTILPLFAWGGYWAPNLFSLVFGERWSEAGLYAMAISAPTALSLLTSWPERLFEVSNRQHWALMIQVSFDVISIGLFWWLLHGDTKPIIAVWAYAAVTIMFHLVYMRAIYFLAGLSIYSYVASVLQILIIFALIYALSFLSSFIPGNWWWGASGSCVITLLVSLLGGRRFVSQLKGLK